jgi:hypothetical protein
MCPLPMQLCERRGEGCVTQVPIKPPKRLLMRCCSAIRGHIKGRKARPRQVARECSATAEAR